MLALLDISWQTWAVPSTARPVSAQKSLAMYRELVAEWMGATRLGTQGKVRTGGERFPTGSDMPT